MLATAGRPPQTAALVSMVLGRSIFLFALLALLPPAARAQNSSVHTSWLWHLHQPIYWPEKRAGSEHYENAWDTICLQDGGRAHPLEQVRGQVFDVDDRRAAYQGRPKDALASIGQYVKLGAQVNYSGALMENVQSLGAAGQIGYASSWYQPNRDAKAWTTSGGKPRMDLTNFTYHHARPAPERRDAGDGTPHSQAAHAAALGRPDFARLFSG